MALAALTLLIPSAPTTDPWGWILWGREVAHLTLNTEIHGPPSWKPLPVLFTAPLSLAGSAAPVLWILFVRAAGLLGLVLAFRLGATLVGDRGVAARWAAGALAVLGLALTSQYMRALAHGYTEPLAIALLLGAIDRHLAGRSRQALILGTLVCGTRPEALPLLALYSLLIWRRKEAGLGLLAATLLAVPAAWLIPDWIGSGDPLHGSDLAHRLLTFSPDDLRAALSIVPIVYGVAAIVATVHAGRVRDRTFLALALFVVGWAGLLRLMIALGYPSSERFFFLPAVIVCVLGGAGLVRLAVAPRAPWLRGVFAVTVLALAAWSFGARIQGVVDDARGATQRARTQSELSRAVQLAGGAGLSRCGVVAMPRGLRWTRGMLAWRLELPIGETYQLPVGGGERTFVRLTRGSRRDVEKEAITVKVPPKATVMVLPFAKQHFSFTNSPGRPAPTRLGTSGDWSVYVTDPTRCRRLLAR